MFAEIPYLNWPAWYWLLAFFKLKKEYTFNFWESMCIRDVVRLSFEV